MKHSFFIFILLLFGGEMWSQEPSPGTKELQRYESFFMKRGIPIEGYTYDQTPINLQLSRATKHHRSQRTFYTIGGVLFAAGTILILSSLGPSSEGANANTISNSIGNDFARGMRTMGLTSMGVSIPILFIGSHEQGKRDKALKEVKRLFE